MSPAWHRLTLQQSNLPPLLFQFTWTRKGYVLYITDLTSIWSEQLSHQDILKQAEENATTIDPSEDQDQFEVLLVKIGEALRGDGGSATLNGSETDELRLTTSSKLPAPLRPLKWSMHLSKQSSPSITDQLLLPLLRDEVGWESRQRFLLDQLKHKDWVLGKLFDKFEALGVDLGTVFPAAAGIRAKKGSTRSEIGRAIKGVASFDESKWLRESTRDSPDGSSSLAADVINELVGSDKSVDLENLRAPTDKWWTKLPAISETSFTSDKSDQPQSKNLLVSQGDEDMKESQHDYDLDKDGTSTTSEEDEFQQQETPPRLKAQKKSENTPSQPKAGQKAQPAQSTKDPEATASEDEDEDEAIPAPQRERTRTPGEQRKMPVKSRGLGVIGGKKKKEESPAPAPSPPPELPSTASKPAEDTSNAAVASKPKRTTKLGMIGGKGKNKIPVAPPEPVSPVVAERTREKAQGSPGVNEDTTKAETQAVKEGEPPRVSPKREENTAPAPVQTEEEKTARKREELKRQLAEKSKAPKKKRRF